MKSAIQTLTFSAFAAGAAVVLGVAGLLSIMPVYAAELPTITAVAQNSSNVTVTSGLIGTLVHASVTVASSTASTTPTGTADFNLYSNQTCSGSPLTQAGVVLVNGSASSSVTTLAAGGLSYIVHYSGEGDIYSVGNSACVPVAAIQFSPTVTASLSNTNVQVGSTVYGLASLAGASSTSDGTAWYRVYSNNTCTTLALDAGVKTVTNTVIPNSDAWQFITPGTYYWQVAYSGDVNTGAATSSCAAAGTILTVVATSTPTTTPPVTGAGVISGTVFNDLNKNDVKDGSDVGLAGWTVWLHGTTASTTKSGKGKGSKKMYNAPVVMTATTDANGNYSFANLGAGTYFVEENVQTGWKQTSSDKKIVLTSASSSGQVNFANIQMASTTGNHGHDNDGDNDDSGRGNGNSGKHNGWENLRAKFIGWFRHNNK